MKTSRYDVFVGIFNEKMDVVRCDYIIQYAKTITMVRTRLNGLRRYYYMEVIGRVEPGAETENESGDRVDGSSYAVATGM